VSWKKKKKKKERLKGPQSGNPLKLPQDKQIGEKKRRRGSEDPGVISSLAWQEQE